ncbi:MAG: N-formylglutamate amidohydrolase, partial [Mailhella sp.]|nr:N-formylglutamate amidohydrolase [Mailhella sp.]
TERFFSRLGYSVSVDEPFSGSMVPMAFYRRDSRVSSIMIELNRDLYMDRRADRNGHYAELKKQVGDYLSIAEAWIGRQ